MTISEKIYCLRKERNLSQEELAQHLGVSRQAVSKWESGQSAPDFDKLVAMSDFFQVTTDYLMKEQQGSTEISSLEIKRIDSVPSLEEKAGNRSEAVGFVMGIVLCILGAFGIFIWGTSILFFPVAADQIEASSAIALDGTAILCLISIAVLVIGFLFLLRLRHKNKKRR